VEQQQDRATDADWVRDAVGRFEGPLVRYAARLLGDVERARDVVQDTFLKLWETDRVDVDGHLAPWLYTVCRNRALDVMRKEGRMSTLSDGRIEASPRPAGDGPDPEGTSQVLALLDRLPRRQQDVIRLKFQCGLSYKDIGQVTQLSVSHVGVLIHHGMKAIREQLLAAGRLDPSASR
jgi:RNA polymerase sigma-70 factor (ECF subfamily)